MLKKYSHKCSVWKARMQSRTVLNTGTSGQKQDMRVEYRLALMGVILTLLWLIAMPDVIQLLDIQDFSDFNTETTA